MIQCSPLSLFGAELTMQKSILLFKVFYQKGRSHVVKPEPRNSFDTLQN